MAPKYRLSYFNARGVAEVARYMFAYANVPYDDNRIPREQWPELKSQQPFGKLPVLEIDGEKLAESRAIFRYLADEFGLLGKTKLEAAKCEMFISALADLLAIRRQFIMEPDEVKKEEIKKKFVTESIPAFFPFLQKQLKQNGGKYFVGDSLSVADLAIAQVAYELRKKIPHILDNFEDLKEHTDNIHNIPAIKNWVENRPETEL